MTLNMHFVQFLHIFTLKYWFHVKSDLTIQLKDKSLWYGKIFPISYLNFCCILRHTMRKWNPFLSLGPASLFQSSRLAKVIFLGTFFWEEETWRQILLMVRQDLLVHIDLFSAGDFFVKTLYHKATFWLNINWIHRSHEILSRLSWTHQWRQSRPGNIFLQTFSSPKHFSPPRHFLTEFEAEFAPVTCNILLLFRQTRFFTTMFCLRTAGR